MSISYPQRRAVRVLAVHLAVVLAGSLAHGLLGPLLLVLTLADCALILWAAAPHAADRAGDDG
ncbi:hypothetical protein [Streptomyces sp. GC420]|uniref:hypothetical protein n=1 Tax=Streptomyces sp. GC420 TaxID=2697568 RepID=UPI001415254B|nr:hypothetical protein [Streptomyces sp. GC420]NBM14711.1 hypothetical protein [Streptomyces sp. GC420]